ncbi:MAG: amidohydrolase family protein [Microlunatus sp.]|nr:amidohydrolase family protein [Microlunatus sp.]MDN5771080.1 amidohydrolase family protein [Microlunatus sp.]MDN5803416.1 amidohydrolase family protein [Microlunatus sp.]
MSSVIISNAHIFDGVGFLTEDADVVIRDGRVAAVDPGAGALPEHADIAERVDAGGHTVLPGLVDLHVHSVIEGAGDLAHVSEPFSLHYYQSVQYLERTLRCGITSIRDAGGAELGTKVAVDRGIIKGPRMRIAVTIMSQTGGHGDGMRHSGIEVPLLPTSPGRPRGIADGPEDCRRVAREIFRAGADHIKICTSGGVLSPTDDPRHPQFTVAEIRAIVEEAQAHGTYVMAHAQGEGGIRNALLGGVKTIEHGIYLDDATIQLMLDTGAWLVPTLIAPLWVVRASERPRSALPANVVDKAKAVVDIHRAAVAHAFDAGVPIAMGTDTGVGPHGSNLEEIYLMTQIGMSLEQALRAATSDAGAFIGPGGYGALNVGSVGDAVLLDRRLTDASHLVDLDRKIAAVYKDGVSQF